MLVKAKVAHTQPGTLAYREADEEFELDGKPYKHVEVVKHSAPLADESETEEKPATTVSKKPIR